MNRLLVVLVLLAVGVVSLGFYQGWFRLSTDNAEHKPNVTLTVDQDKFQEDENKAKVKLQNLGQKGKDSISVRTDKVEEVPSQR